MWGEHPDCGDFYPSSPPEYQAWKPRSRPDEGEYPDEPVAPEHTQQFEFENESKSMAKLRKGQRLYYRNKFTGKIESIVVSGHGRYKFWFYYHGRKHEMSYDVLGVRLYFTYEGAERSKK